MSQRAPRRTLASLLVVVLAFVGWGPVTRASAEPVFVGWTAVLPPLATNFDPSSSDDCVAGRAACVRKTIRQMKDRFEPLAKRCDHDAVFSLAYLRTTEAFLEASETPKFFRDPRRINHQAVAFARMYFGAYDDWHAGRVARVAPAWRVAFKAADDRAVSGAGDLLLGMNAHVNRDLPFVLVATGMVGAPNGKHDHDKINEVLNKVAEPMMAELAKRFDPAIDDSSGPHSLGYAALLNLLYGWRQNAWTQAERLATAPDAAARQHVADEIEASAEVQARSFVTTYRYNPPLTTTTARDDYCRAAQGAGS
jgi:hypothetical protein